jgi:hypothetical protein
MWEYRLLYAQIGSIDRPRPIRTSPAPTRTPQPRRVFKPSDDRRVRMAAAH